MTKKSKTKSVIKSGVPQSSFHKQTFLEQAVKWQWFPYVLIGFLSVLYFVRLFQGNLTFFQSEGGVLAYRRFGWGTPFTSPFKEDALWYNTSLGGLPGAQGLIAYTQFLINNILITLVPEYIAFGVYYILLTFTAGVGMYLLLHRGMGMHRLTSLIISVAYMFAPVNLSITHAGHMSKMGVYAILPFQFWTTQKGMDTGRFKYFLYLGGLIALSIGTAHLQYAYLALWGLALFGLFKFFQILKQKVSLKSSVLRGFYLACAAVIGLGISFRAFAPQYLHTTTVSKRAVATENQEARKTFAASWSLHPEEVASLILPEFAGFDLGKEGQHYWGRNSFKINSEYFGILMVLFAIGSLFMLKKKGLIQFSVLLFLFALLYSLGDHTPLFTLGYYFIPGMKVVRSLAFLSFLFSFAAMILAGFGLNQFFDPEERKQIQWSKWFWIVVVFLGLGFFCVIMTGPLLGLWKSFLYSGLEGQKAQAMIANQNEIKIGGMVLIVITSALLGLLYAYRSGKISSTVFGISLLLIIVFDSWRIDKQFLEWIPLDRVTSPSEVKIPPYEFLKEQDKSLYRILPFDNNARFTYPNVNLVTGFNDFMGLEYNNVLNQLNLPLLNLLCCKYIISRGQKKLQGLPQIYSQDDWYIYKNPYSFQYIYIANKWQVETNKDRVLKLIASGSQDFSRVPIIEKNPPAGFIPSQSVSNDSIAGTVKFLNQDEYYQGKLSEDIFQVNRPVPELLVISENYHPDWHGYIDGKETPVYKVNYLWRGIFVPAGEHRVEFRFQPRIINISRTISFLFMLGYVVAIGGVIVVPLIRRQ